jgi:hypothetical protein
MCFEHLQARLPLYWPTPSDTPGCPKLRFRSHYRYQGWEELRDESLWEELTTFTLLLYLVDFSPLGAELARLMHWCNDRGWMPFDPVSIFLLKLWQLENRWNRSQVVANLRQPEYAQIASRMGFEGCYPTEGGLRYIETCLGWQATSQEIEVLGEDGQIVRVAVQPLNALIAQSVELLRQAGLITAELWQAALLCPDGMLHAAASHMDCASVNAACYQLAPRHCAAREKGKRGCDCSQIACQQVCRFATPRDQQARFVWYSGSNGRPDNPNQALDPTQEKPRHGKGVYGYRSLTLQLSDPRYRFNLSLLADFQPANLPELPFATAQLLQLGTYYPDLKVMGVAGDAAFGCEPFLHTVYTTLLARRLVDLRAHKTDQDASTWPTRGYDDKGRPLCPFGYRLTSNGFDAEHRRHKWTCEKACQRGSAPRVALEAVSYPPSECPYQDPQHQHGKVLNVAERFADGSLRLVRDLPVGSPSWKRYYHQARNAAEARNAFLESLHLKRMPVYGLQRGKFAIFLADVWRNLSTLARLIREATLTAGGSLF